MTLYLIPGLGFDQRIFHKLNLGNHNIHYLDWLAPLQGESFQQYGSRMATSIPKNTNQKIILIGHSLGGIMSQEIATIRPIEKVILISSIRSREELPLPFKVIQPMALHHLFTKQLTAMTFKFWGKKHGYESPEEQALFIDMINQHSNAYLQWALRQLSIWQTPAIPAATAIHQIHGEKDHTFPISLLKNPDRIIDNGSHFMVYKKPELISEAILKAIVSE